MQNTARILIALFQRRDVVVFTVLFLLVGAVLGYVVFPEAWSPPLRVLAGLAMGFNGVLYVIGPRMIGGDDFDN